MARKLNAEEERLFAKAFEATQWSPFETANDPWLHSLGEKRDSALAMTPELGAWFGEEFPARSH